jgi:endonuclease IV
MLKKELPKAVESELKKALDKKATKDEIATITKKVMKKVYSDISVHHPYIIDRVRL